MPPKSSHTDPTQHNMTMISDGWLSTARHVKSPNYNQRPDGTDPKLVVIHNISLPPEQFDNDYVEQFFLNQLDHEEHPYFQEIKGLEVSAHLFIKRTGEVLQFVSFADRAWHAGKSCYLGIDACNDYSIGIELEGSDTQTFTDAQYTSLTEAVSAIHNAYPQTKHHLTGHSDIAPGRKTDPGEHFDWQRLRRSLHSMT